MRPARFAGWAALAALNLLLAAPASAQQDGPRARVPVTTEEVGGFVVLTMFFPGGVPGCSITGPMQAPFRMGFLVDRDKTVAISLINTAWNLNRNSKGNVTLKVAGATITRTFGVQGGSSATTVLRTFVPQDDPEREKANGLALAALTPGASTEVAFADGQAYSFAGPPQEASAAFQRCLVEINRPVELPRGFR